MHANILYASNVKHMNGRPGARVQHLLLRILMRGVYIELYIKKEKKTQSLTDISLDFEGISALVYKYQQVLCADHWWISKV